MQQKGLNSNRIIVNAAAPIVEIKIIVDNRYDPPELQLTNSHMMPASVVAAHLTNCLGNVLNMIVQAEAQALAAGQKPPDLPPAPEPS